MFKKSIGVVMLLVVSYVYLDNIKVIIIDDIVKNDMECLFCEVIDYIN